MRRVLLRWFRAYARELPWRGTSDAYAIWVSEIMLQQTQVATVIPYYERFLRAFPTAAHLARARFERVAALWSGLGYYRRARHMHQASRQIVKDFAGQFPNSYPEARKLPGVGHYTASAVLSIAYHKPFAVLDGNVARVVARLDALAGNIQQSVFRAQIEQRLGAMLSRRKPGDFNQAMMELGQTVCLPRAPRCPKCPLRRMCKAYSANRKGPIDSMAAAEAFPAPRPRRALERRHLAAAIFRKDGCVALTRGLDEGLLQDVWNFPSAFGETVEDALERLAQKLNIPFPMPTARKIGTARHSITYRSIQVDCFEFEGNIEGEDFRWFHAKKLDQAAVSQLARKIMHLAMRTSPHNS